MPGDSRKGEGERKEALLKESPGEEGRRAGQDGWSGRSQGPKKGSLYVIVLEPPNVSAQPAGPARPPTQPQVRAGRMAGHQPAQAPDASLIQGSQPTLLSANLPPPPAG